MAEEEGGIVMGSSENLSGGAGQIFPAAEKRKMPRWLLMVCVAEAVLAAILALLVAIPTRIPYPTASGEDAEKRIRTLVSQAQACADKPGSTRDEVLRTYENALKEASGTAWAIEIKRRIEKAKLEYEKRAQEALAKFNLAFGTLIEQEDYPQAQTELENFSNQFKDCEICKEQIDAMGKRLSLLIEARKECYAVIEQAGNLWRQERASEALELLGSFPARYQDTVYAARVKTKKDEIAAYLAQIAAAREAAERRRQEDAAELQRLAEEESKKAQDEAQKRWVEDQMKRAEEERKKREEEERRKAEEARAKEEESKPKEPEKEDGEPWTVVEMKSLTQDKFPFITPFPTDSPLATGPRATATLRFLPLPNEGRKFGYAVEDRQTSIEIDADADGVLDTHLQGNGGIVTVKVFYGKEEGEALYTVRISRVEGSLVFRRHCFTAGKFGNIKLFLIDEDNNGAFNDYGIDALSLGDNHCACTLTNVMMIGGKLFEVQVSRSGKKLSLRPFTAKTGKLNLVSGFKANANLLYAIVLGKIKNEKGKEYTAAFDLAGQPKGVDIPVGTYELHAAAAITSGKRLLAKITKTKDCKQITVAESSSVKIDWGAPAHLDFSYTITASDYLRVKPESIKIYGAYGELYSDVGIDDLLPTVEVKSESGVIVLTRSFTRTQDGQHLEIFESLVPTVVRLKVRVFGKVSFLGDASSEWK
jgi:hypothetical protein